MKVIKNKLSDLSYAYVLNESKVIHLKGNSWEVGGTFYFPDNNATKIYKEAGWTIVTDKDLIQEFWPIIEPHLHLPELKNDEDEYATSDNNGGNTDYYKLKSSPFPIEDFDDFAEWRKLNGNQFNIGKVVWTFNIGRHDGTTYERDLNKVIHYANREKLRLKREQND